MKKTAIGISVVVALLLTASLALAWGPGYGRGAGYAGPSAYGCLYAPNFNLTADQTGKLTGLQQQFLNETLPVRNELAAKSLELRNLMAQPSPNAATISRQATGDLRPAAENAGKVSGLSDERPEHPDAAAGISASSRMRPGVCGGYRLWRPGSAAVMAGAWGIAPVSEAVMAVGAAWAAEPGSGEPGNERMGEGEPLPQIMRG